MSTVNRSFNPDLLKQVDKVAEQESRSRSELIREAARSYIERKGRWAKVFELGSRTAKTRAISYRDLETKIAAHRKGSRK